MQTLSYSARGLSLLARLNVDRFLMSGTLAASLLLAAYLAELI